MTKLPCLSMLDKLGVHEAIDSMTDALRRVLPEVTFGERERFVLALVNEVARETLEIELQALADELGDGVIIDGDEYAEHSWGTVDYHSLVGDLEVSRRVYRLVSKRNGPTVVALDWAAGIVERATPALAKNIALGYSRTDMREHLDSLESAHRCPPSRSTLERIATAIGEAATEDVRVVERRVRHHEALPKGAHAVAVGLDRTAVAMVEERPPGAPHTSVKRRKMRVRRAPKPFDVAWRMAYIATVSIVDEDGESLMTRRYAAPAGDDAAELMSRAADDVRNALHRNPDLAVGIIQDGAHEMWNVVRAALEPLKSEGLLEKWHEGIDRYHLLEHLAQALAIADDHEGRRRKLLEEWKHDFDESDRTIDVVYKKLHELHAGLSKRKQAEFWPHLAYVRGNKDRMRYVRLRRRGLPVGSGATESAAKTVIAERAKRSGQRWSEPGLRGALTLRGVEQSQRFEPFWSRFATRYTTKVDAA